MKKALLILFILPAMLFAQTNDSFVITGTLKGMLDNTELVLKNEEIEFDKIFIDNPAKALTLDMHRSSDSRGQ